MSHESGPGCVRGCNSFCHALTASLATLFIMIALGVYGSTAVSAQEPSIKGEIRVPDEQSKQIITLTDGSTIVGRITSFTDDKVTIKSDLGEMTVEKSKIREIKEVPSGSIKGGKYWFENPNCTRLYFGPTARMLKKGRAYFSDYLIFFPGIAVGVTDYINIGGGFSILPGIDLNEQIYYITPKIGIAASSKLSLAVGGLIMALPEIDNERHTIGVLYGIGTVGGPDASVTGGLGFGFVNEEIADKAMIMIGGEKRFTRRISIVSENWVLPGVDDPIISYGLRFFGEDISVDLGLFNILSEDAIFPGIPWIDFVFNF